MADSISSLPDEILGKILSLVPTKVAASTSVLSRRWRNLVGLVDSLCFDESMVVYPDEEEAASGSHRFVDFVDKTCGALLLSNSIKKLSLSHVPRPDRFDEDCRVYRWVWVAVERGLSELYLHASPRYSFVTLVCEFFTSNTLVKLTLSGDYSLETTRVSLPALKSLSLLSVLGLDYYNYCRLLDGCPVLEDLFITDADHSYHPCCGTVVESESVKRLVVFVHLPDSKEHHDAVLLNAPSLLYLDYSSYVSVNYQFLDLDSLVEARLSLRLWESNDYNYSDDDDDYYCYYDFDDEDYHYSYYDKPKSPIFGDVTNLVAGISNITTLHLSPDSLEVFHFCCESMPMFNRLLNLSIESNKEKGWQVMPILLKSCPNLQSLVIKGLLHRVTNRCGDACACIPKKMQKKKKKKKKKKRKIVKQEEEVCCLWTCQVEVLEISDYGGSFQELNQMRHFLGKLECLKTVKVGFDADNNNNNSSKFLQANLLALPRLSSECNFQFI